jgi:hypothetical protein
VASDAALAPEVRKSAAAETQFKIEQKHTFWAAFDRLDENKPGKHSSSFSKGRICAIYARFYVLAFYREFAFKDILPRKSNVKTYLTYVVFEMHIEFLCFIEQLGICRCVKARLRTFFTFLRFQSSSFANQRCSSFLPACAFTLHTGQPQLEQQS